MSILAASVALLAAVVLTVALCRRLGLPTILGYLAVGLAFGPHALGLVRDNEAGRQFAEVGVLFMLFSIGLEFSLAELKGLRGTALKLGALQMALTTALAAVAALLFGVSWQGAIAIGAALAISSTAIGSKMLTERGELLSDHGKRVIGVLLFQDLAVIPFLIVLPALASQTDLFAALGLAALKAVVALGLILRWGRPLMRWWMAAVAARRSPELFMLNILLVTLGFALLTESTGLSLALGAFLAGMLIAETEFRYQVEEDIKPFRDVFLGFFFVTLGMQLNVASVLPQLAWVIVLVIALVALKAAIVFGILYALHTSMATRLRTAIYLAQAGEFSFVLLSLAGQLNSVDEHVRQPLLAAMLLSLLLSPLLIAQSDKIVRKLTANDWMARAVALTQIAAVKLTRQDHIIICGYGRSGQFLARLLDTEKIPWLALDNDPQRVREAAAAGEHVVYGDASRAEALAAAGVTKSKAVIITFIDPPTAKKILRTTRKANANVPIIVRTIDESTIKELMDAGASEVVPEVLEGSLMLASQAMLTTGTPLNHVLRLIRGVREEQYNLFRGFFHGATDTPETDEAALRMHALVLSDGARGVGKKVADFAWSDSARLHSVRRLGTIVNIEIEDFAFESGDHVVLVGTLAGVAKMQERLGA